MTFCYLTSCYMLFIYLFTISHMWRKSLWGRDSAILVTTVISVPSTQYLAHGRYTINTYVMNKWMNNKDLNHVRSEKAMAPHSSTLAWKIPWMEEPGGLQSVGSLSRTRLSDFTFTFSLLCIGEGNGNPLQCSCLENSRGRIAWWADVYGVTQSRTRLKWLSSSSIWNEVIIFVFLYETSFYRIIL